MSTDGDITVTTADQVIISTDTSGNAFNMKLPVGVNGLFFNFIVSNAAGAAGATYTLVANGGDTIDAGVPPALQLSSPHIGIIYYSGVWYWLD